ncbi:unnamed protein product [Prunus armeniaca]|uniref:CCHC-type domain-containing protein n=1 Tax=Prunus armeniaca TaxID=36596 RepID=A0A6J5VX92_PRUAR|nr:unnamed protein product [Prunus armeniaca]
MSWDFRAPGAPHPSYGDPELFSIRMYHGGQICGNYYASGSVACNGGLTKLNDDQDVIDMLVVVPETRLIDIFLHHGVDSVERESFATIEKGKSKVNSVFGKRRARAFGKRRCQNVKKTRDKEDQSENTVTEGLVEKEVVEESVEKSKLSRCHPMKTRKARKMTTVCHDEEESADSLDSDFADLNFRKELESTNAGVESWDLGVDVELDSEEYDSDNVQPTYYFDDDTPMINRWPEFNSTIEMADPEFEVGMKFSDCKVFRSVVREHFIKRNMDVIFVRSEAFKLKAVCAYPNCPWEIYASKMQHEKTLQVKKYEGEHTCGIVWENPTMKSSWLSAKYMETLKHNPSWPVSSFMKTVEKDYNTGWLSLSARTHRLQFKGKALYDKLWGAAKATTVPQFARQMEELKNLDMDAYAWLTEPRKPPRHWSRSHFSTHRMGFDWLALCSWSGNYKLQWGPERMDYVDACYHTQTYFKAYENLILPMNGMELWDRTNMPPCVLPSYSKQPKRPRKGRRKEAGECNNKANVVTKAQDSLRCGQCGRKGHNKRTCHRNLPPKTKIKKRKAEQTTQTSEASPSTKTRRAKLARYVQKGKWKRKATIVAGSSNAQPTDSATPSSTPATGSAPPASIEASTGNSYLLRKRPMVVLASDLSKE